MSTPGHGRGAWRWSMLLGTGQMSDSIQGQRVAAEQKRDGRRRDRGTALVEFTFVALLLFTLIFGIISYAYMMSLRQSMTQATAEGARAGAVAVSGSAVTSARNALNQALDQHDVSCSGTILKHSGADVGTCSVSIAACPAPSTNQCVTVTASYDYRDHPLLPAFPGLNLVLPEHIAYSAVAEIN